MDAREQVREAIRAEVARQNPVEDARHSLELIAETAVRFEGDGTAGYRVIDERGEPRTRFENGAAVDFTIRDLVAELREKHPTLFQGPPIAGIETPDQPGESLRRAEELDETPAADSLDEAPVVEVAPTEPRPVRAEMPDDERTMPRAAPFGANLNATSSDAPATAARDVSASQSRSAANGSRPGPRDWLILDGGKREAEVVASPRDISGPAAASSSQAPPRTPPHTGPASRSTGATPSAAARAPVAPGRTRSARRPATLAYAVLGGLAVLSTGAYLAAASRASGPDLLPKEGQAKQAELKQAEKTRARTAPAPQPPADPVATGSVTSSPPTEPTPARPGPVEPGPITGVPEVIDTATLRIDGKVVRLLGVEWARGGRGDNLTSYLGGREVTCQPAEASELYRCKVDGRDLSQVVLYNGGGRASPNAPADLLAAENYARTERIGVWQK